MTTTKNVIPAKFRCIVSEQCPSIHELENVTPAEFKCDDMDALCPSIHQHKNGDIILVGQHVSRGELTNMKIGAGQGEGAIRLSREFIDAFFMEYRK